MAATVAQPLERQFSLIAGLTEMTSASYLGSTQITLQFDLDRNIDAAATDVLAAINAASGSLPADLPNPPTFRKTNPADRPILILAVTSDTLPLNVASDFADNVLAQQISQIRGVGEVDIFGQQKPAVRIQVDPARLAALGLSLEDIRQPLTNATINAPKGTFDGPRRSVTVYDNDQILAASVWDDVIVAWHNGAPVRVRDIGRAVDGAENTKLAAWAYAGAGAAPEFNVGHNKRGAGGRAQGAGRQRDRHRRPRRGGAAAAARVDPAGDQRQHRCPIARRRSAPRCTTSSSR